MTKSSSSTNATGCTFPYPFRPSGISAIRKVLLHEPSNKNLPDVRRRCTECAQTVLSTLRDSATRAEYFQHCSVLQHYCPRVGCGVTFRRESDYQRHCQQQHQRHYQQSASFNQQTTKLKGMRWHLRYIIRRNPSATRQVSQQSDPLMRAAGRHNFLIFNPFILKQTLL